MDYVPIKMDLSDLEEKILWAKKRDRQARKMAKQAQIKIRRYFSYQSLQCYAIHLLGEYQRLVI